LSGIVTSEAYVNIYTDYFYAADNAEVTITIPGVNVLTKFYICRRELSGRKVSLTCRSKLFRLDTPVDLADTDFDDNGEIDTYTAISRIAAQCELTSFSYQGGNIFDALPKLQKDFIFGKNSLTILEKISAALCGTFREYNGGLIFIPWGVPFMQGIPAEPLSEIKRGFVKTVGKLVMTGGGKSYVYGNGGYTATVKLDTPLASTDAASAVLSRIAGKTYEPYSADVKLTYIPCATGIVTIADEELFTNNIVCYPRRSGIYAKVSCNAVNEDEWDYSGEIERAVREKITAGERFGNMTLTPDGQIKLDNGDSGTAAIYTTVDFGINCKTQKARIEAETLSLEEVPEIKLNSEELLTESKDLIGALNELFLAEPEGGEGGITDASELDNYHCGKVFGKRSKVAGEYSFEKGMIGIYYAEPRQADNLTMVLQILLPYTKFPKIPVALNYSVWAGNESEDGVIMENKGTFSYSITAEYQNTTFTIPLTENVVGEYSYWAIIPEGAGKMYGRIYDAPLMYENLAINNRTVCFIYNYTTPAVQSFFGAVESATSSPYIMTASIGAGNKTNILIDFGGNPGTARYRYGTGLLNQALAAYNADH
jgi:hypothetical protein